MLANPKEKSADEKKPDNCQHADNIKDIRERDILFFDHGSLRSIAVRLDCVFLWTPFAISRWESHFYVLIY